MAGRAIRPHQAFGALDYKFKSIDIETMIPV